ncbi:putative protein K02A2.6, partial [Mucuna pruriens]
MIAKSRTPDQHVEDLRKLFERIQKYKVRLNLAKCTFGVKTGKLLGFIVNQRGIEIDSNKVRAIQNMPPPRTETKVRGFLGRVNYIARSTSCSRLGDTGEAPNIVPDSAGRINGWSVGATRHLREERIGHILPQQEIHRLRTKIPSIGANMLRSSLGSKKAEEIRVGPHYMTHSQDGPLQIYLRKASIGRTNSMLADGPPKGYQRERLGQQLAHHPLDDYQPLLHEFPDEHIMVVEGVRSKSDPARWKLWFDGASNLLGNGIGVVLASLEGQCFPFSAKLSFDCTNYMAEYEACAMGITMAIEHQVKTLRVFGDSTLVIYQLRGE